MNCLSVNKWIIQSITEHATNNMRLLQLLIDKVPTDEELSDETKETVQPILHSLYDGEHAALDTCSSLLDIIAELDKVEEQNKTTYYTFNPLRAKKPSASEEVIEPQFD